MNIKKARCMGMCSGVKRALKILEEALSELAEEKLYVYNDIVHNSFVINELKRKGVKTVYAVDDIPDNSAVVFSAHGVSRNVEAACKRKNLRVFDASCLLVKKNHHAVEEAFSRGRRVIFIGKHSHPECVGTIGRIEDGACYIIENEEDVNNLPEVFKDAVIVSQTTLAISDVEKIRQILKQKYPDCEFAGGICYATGERQEAIKELAKECDIILVAGSAASSNSLQLVKIARESGCRAYLVDSLETVEAIDFSGCKNVGVSAGASTPESQINELLDFIRRR